MHVPSLLRQNYIQMWILQTAFWVSTKYQLNFKGNFTIIAYAKTQTLTSSPITIVVKQHSESNQQRFPTQNIQQRSESERASDKHQETKKELRYGVWITRDDSHTECTLRYILDSTTEKKYRNMHADSECRFALGLLERRGSRRRRRRARENIIFHRATNNSNNQPWTCSIVAYSMNNSHTLIHRHKYLYKKNMYAYILTACALIILFVCLFVLLLFFSSFHSISFSFAFTQRYYSEVHHQSEEGKNIHKWIAYMHIWHAEKKRMRKRNGKQCIYAWAIPVLHAMHALKGTH